MVPYAGFTLPVQYGGGIITEHKAVRNAAGLFDVSHMGELLLSGPGALQSLNRLLTNDFTGMADGQARYSPMCTPDGGIVDDVIVYRLRGEKYLMVVNAANREKDAAWVAEHCVSETEMRDCSDDIAQIALQGPLAEEILREIAAEDCIPAKYYTAVESATVAGICCMVSRTGYTGEAGFELYCKTEDATRLWDTLLSVGGDRLIPCGLGARDTLRFEAGMPLYGHEMAENITPLEAGLDRFVRQEKSDFIGKSALLGFTPTQRRAGLRLTGKGIARGNEPVFAAGEQVGYVTSGTFCPHLNGAFAMALLPADCPDQAALEIEVRGRRIAAEIVPLPFYRQAK